MIKGSDFRHAVWIMILSVLAAGCGGGAGSATSGSVAGTWTGSFIRTSPDMATGAMTLTVTESGDAVSGSGMLTQLGSVTVAGTFDGTNWDGTLANGTGTVTYSTTVSGSTCTGTYTSSLGDSGSVNLTRQ